jgi:hypothetical protein
LPSFAGARGWVLNHSYYDTIAYEDILKSFVGDAKLIESQVSKRTRSGGGECKYF